MIILGIDPGVTGGLAFIGGDCPVDVYDIPSANGEIDCATLGRLIGGWMPTAAFIERASSRPGQGVASTFKYGAAYGALRAVVQVCGVPLHLVAPHTWKKHFKLDSDKEKARALAIRLWPGCPYFSRKKDHGRAEAALIARYGAETLVQITKAEADAA
jgi:hypothetical protein